MREEYRLREVFPGVTPHEFYTICFGSPDFYYKFQQSLGNRNIEVPTWSPAPEDRQQRTVLFQTSAANTGRSLHFSGTKSSDYVEMVPVREIQLVYFEKGVLHFNSIRDSFEVQSDWTVAPRDGGCECTISVKCSYKGLLLQDKETTAGRHTRDAYAQFLSMAKQEVENYKRERVSQTSLEEDHVESDSSSVDIANDLHYERGGSSDAESSTGELILHQDRLGGADDDEDFYDANDIVTSLDKLPKRAKSSAIETIMLSLQNDVSQIRSLTNNIHGRVQNLESSFEDALSQQQQLTERVNTLARSNLPVISYSNSSAAPSPSPSPFTSPSRRQQSNLLQSAPSIPTTGPSNSSSSNLANRASAQFYSHYLSSLEELRKEQDKTRRDQKLLSQSLTEARKKIATLESQLTTLQKSGPGAASSSSLSSLWVWGFGIAVLVLVLGSRSIGIGGAGAGSGVLSWVLSSFTRLRDSFTRRSLQ